MEDLPNFTLKVGFGLKLLGVDWRSEKELIKCLVFFEKIGLIERFGMDIQANPKSIFQ